MKYFLSSFFLVLFIFNCVAFGEEGMSFREKMREKVKARMMKRESEMPSPKTDEEKKSGPLSAGDYTFSFTHNDNVRFYKVHVPAQYDSSKPTPLVFSFHGGGGDMNIQSNDKFYNHISKSNKEGFVVVFPNGYSKFSSGKFATWNAGKCCGDARDKKVDDVGFIKEIIERLSSQLNIDKNKIFATGMSNGGMMSYRLACELPGVFKAIAAVAGSDNTIDCDPSTIVSILHIHARNDDRVLFNGGSGQMLSKIEKSQVTDFFSVPETISKWVKINGCDDKPTKVLEVTGAYCELYSSCKKKSEVKLCVTEEGGHSWPGGIKPRGNEKTSSAISANDLMWDFFKTK